MIGGRLLASGDPKTGDWLPATGYRGGKKKVAKKALSDGYPPLIHRLSTRWGVAKDSVLQGIKAAIKYVLRGQKM